MSFFFGFVFGIFGAILSIVIIATLANYDIDYIWDKLMEQLKKLL